MKILLNHKKSRVIHITLHEFAYLLRYLKSSKSILTVCDLIQLERGGDYPLFMRIYNRLNLYNLPKAKKIITISKYTKDTILKYFKYNPKDIVVAYLAVDHKHFYRRDSSLFRKRLGLAGKKVILYVGSEQPRKNFDILIKAFAEVHKKLPETRLVKIGSAQWSGAREKHLSLIKKLGLKKYVNIVDYVDEKELPYYYSMANVFVFPSEYEGFGLPLLEAMACGCPAITTKYTSLPEVGGKAVIYVNPKNITQLAKEIERVLRDKKLSQTLSQKGLIQAKKFNWKASAKTVGEAYNNVNNTKTC